MAPSSQPDLIHEERGDYRLTPEQQAEKEIYRTRLRAFLEDPASRQIEGFPMGETEAILALSDPPFYTACPNPFLVDIIKEWKREREETQSAHRKSKTGNPKYHREPFAADVSEGKNDPIYNAHSYYTKVPHKAIMRYILHYTDPGDVIFDGFCGTGMTGVAAQLCGDKKTVEALDYRVAEDGTIYDGDKPISKIGARKAVLVDLSPAATFIAYNYNTPINVHAFEQEATRIMQEVEQECGWMYETWHPACDAPQKVKGRISFVVWSEVFICPSCSQEVVFLDDGFDSETKKVKESFPCPHCSAIVSKTKLDKYHTKFYDPVLGKTVETLKRQPVLIEYTVGRSKFTKKVDKADLELLEKIDKLPLPNDFVRNELPFMHMTHQRMRIANYGVTHLHHFFLQRARLSLSALWQKANLISDMRMRKFMLFAVEQTIWGMSLLNRYGPTHYSQVNRYLSGVYYISSLISEVSPWYILDGKMKRLAQAFSSIGSEPNQVAIATQSVSAESRFENIADYIFTDPPFGENIYYADLNYLVESWHGVFTNSKPEAIIDRSKHKEINEYQDLMRQAFRQYYQWLKPGHWMTVEFHNSHNAVWNSIQEALASAGFIIADVRTLDKQSSSYRQVTANTATKQDLVISAYKPNDNLEERFRLEAGTIDGAWDFIRYHLSQLPRVVEKDGEVEVVVERQAYLLFDRMVAFHIQRGASVPLSASEFYAGLKQRFAERDGMYFLPEEVAEYDSTRLRLGRVAQLALFVSDEKTAIQWLRQQLEPSMGGKPQTFAELQPQFMREAHKAGYEEMPELGEILAQNFLEDEQGLWYPPNPSKASDLERLRQRSLLKEFATYLEGRGRLRQFRTEAVRAGFADAYRERKYTVILQVAARLPEDVLHEDPDLLMYYDTANLRTDESH